jgi:ribosomal protein L21E
LGLNKVDRARPILAGIFTEMASRIISCKFKQGSLGPKNEINTETTKIRPFFTIYLNTQLRSWFSTYTKCKIKSVYGAVGDITLLREGNDVLIKMNPYMKRKINGKKFIGSGGTRVVYDLGDGYVLKIAKSKKGILCNKMEVNMYKSSLKPIKKYLAQIIDYDRAYRWVTMKKYNLKFPNSPIYRRKLMKLVRKFLDNGIIPSKGISRYYNPYAPNLRLKHLRRKRNKQIVVIDYGGFKYGHI